VLRADSLVDVVFLFTLKAVQHIPAQNIDVAARGDLVPQAFDLNRRLRLPLLPQGRGTFTTSGNTRALPPRRLGGGGNQIARDFQKSSTALNLLLTEQKVQRAPLSGYWKLNV
jgi:hypothetical protein